MVIRTPIDLGALIRDRRIRLGLDQRTLAQKAGTSRQWIVGIEQGKPRAAIGLILRTLQALKVSLDISGVSSLNAQKSIKRGVLVPIDINQIVASFRKPKK